MVNAYSYLVKTQPHIVGRWSANIWEKFGQAKKAVQDAYLRAVGKQSIETSIEEAVSQISHAVTKAPKYQLLQGYKRTIGGYAGRLQHQMAVRGGAWHGRSGYFNRDFLWRRLRTGHLFGFATLFLVHEENREEEAQFMKRINEYERLCDNIKAMFGSTGQEESETMYSILSGSISDYKLGECIAVGCNGAVYDVEVRNTRREDNFQEVKHQNSKSMKKSFKKKKSTPRRKQKMAVKMIFNYDSSNAGAIYKQTKSELVTCGRGALDGLSKDWQNGSRSRMKTLPPHPNIMKVQKAFIDKVPDHPDFSKMHPASLQHPVGFGRSSTMFLVMKRYQYTLEEYLKRNIPDRLRHILSLQLLQGVSHLEKNLVAHRDLKSNNIMIEHDSTSLPRLVIGDFGCSFVPECGMNLTFPSQYDIRNGNAQIQPPEIQTWKPGPDSVLDYRKSDAWAVGILFCEIMGIKKEQLNLVENANNMSFMKGLTRMLLKEDPEERISCTEAANILYLEMFGPKLENLTGFAANVKNWLLLHVSETLAYKSTQWGKDSVICEIFTNFFVSLSFPYLSSALTGWRSLSFC